MQSREEVLQKFTEGLVIWEREGERQRRMADHIVQLTERLAAVETDAKRYVYIRSLLRHYKWRDVDPIHELAPEFEKYITDDDLDLVLDEQIKYEEQEVNDGISG